MKKMFAMLLCLAILALGTGAALAEGTKLTVSGSGTVLVESDLAVVTVGVREASTDVLVAQSTVNEKIAAIKQALLDAGAKESEINTDSINIYANYDYSDNTEVIVGYTANNTLSVRTTDIDNVGALIDAAFAAGANTLDNVQFTVQDDTRGPRAGADQGRRGRAPQGRRAGRGRGAADRLHREHRRVRRLHL